MTFGQTLQNSAQAVADSTALTPATADSLNAVETISRNIGEAGRQFASGDVGAFENLYSSLGSMALTTIPSLISGLIVFILLYVVYRLLRYFLGRVLIRSKTVDSGLQGLLLSTFRIVGLSFIAIMVFSQFGVNITALIAGLSVVGIAIGLASQDTVNNFISGVTILMDSPFRVGHFIEIEEVQGTVEEITLRSTRIRTLNNQMMVLPNSQMINQKLLNHTMLGVIRVEIPFGIAYKEYPESARSAILKSTQEDPRLHPDYPSTVVVDRLSDSSIDMILRIYLKDPRQEIEIGFEYAEKIREILRSSGIEIPFPHLQLFMEGGASPPSPPDSEVSDSKPRWGRL